MTRELDEKDQEIARTRAAKRDERKGPRVGDFIIMANGATMRFSHNWDEDGLQISEGGEFYLYAGGMSFSGGLYPTVPLDQIEETDEIRDGCCWFFHHDRHKAHNGVVATIPCRVYRQVNPDTRWRGPGTYPVAA